jgi:hypothetical protein
LCSSVSSYVDEQVLDESPDPSASFSGTPEKGAGDAG